MQAEEVKPYKSDGAKGEQVEEMFDSIAPAYDFMNAAMTFGLHRRWLRKALQAISQNPETVIDLATGTGDVAFRLAERYPGAHIVGVDLSEGMLEVARKKGSKTPGAHKVEFLQGDCMDLAFPDSSFDLLTIAYGVRNFEDLRKGFREFYRVLKPGGRFMILELSRPENRIVRFGYDLYSRGIIPLVGRIVSKDRRAYSYLPQSIAAMPARKKIAEMLSEAGFSRVGFKSLTLGVVTFYVGQKS